jgi:hypothetical protein
MMKVHRRKRYARTRAAIVIVARKKKGLQKGIEIANRVSGTEMNAE